MKFDDPGGFTTKAYTYFEKIKYNDLSSIMKQVLCYPITHKVVGQLNYEHASKGQKHTVFSAYLINPWEERERRLSFRIV